MRQGGKLWDPLLVHTTFRLWASPTPLVDQGVDIICLQWICS